MKPVRPLLLLGLVVSCASVAAQREEIVVYAPAEVSRGLGLPATAVRVLEADALRLHAGQRSDALLKSDPAFALFRRTGSSLANPTSQGVSLRGIAPSGTSRTLVMLDGIPVNDPFGGWVYWSRIPHRRLARAEIAPGGGSALWGSAALSGVIDLRSETPQAGAWLDAGVSSPLGGHLGAGAAQALGAGSLWFSGAMDDGAAHPVVPANQRGQIDRDAYSRHRQATLHYRRTSAAGELHLGANGFEETRNNGTALTGNDTRLQQLHASGQRRLGPGQLHLLGYVQHQRYASRFSAQAADRDSERPALDQFAVPARAVGAAVYWKAPLGDRHQLGLGWDLRGVDGETRERYFFSNGEFQRRRTAGAAQILHGLWLADHIEDGPRRWQFAARVDQWRNTNGFRRESDRGTGESLRDDSFADRDRWLFSPQLGLRWALPGRHMLRATAYRAFRAPTVNELVRPFRVGNDITAANAGLEPEIISGAELGSDLRFGSTEVSLTAYWNRLEDAIANVTIGSGPGQVGPCGFVPEGGSCRQRQNVESVRAYGIEALLHHRFERGWSVNAAALWGRARRGDLDLDVAQSPRLTTTAGVRYEGPLSAALSLRHVGAQYDDDLNNRRLGSATLVALALDYRWRPRLRFWLAVENLLDREVATARSADGRLGIDAGRTLSAGVAWAFRKENER